MSKPCLVRVKLWKENDRIIELEKARHHLVQPTHFGHKETKAERETTYPRSGSVAELKPKHTLFYYCLLNYE